MNALKSMMKATARVRRDGIEAEIPAEQLVIGDVVLISAGDQVPADGRIVAASALQIDESALTGESIAGGEGRRSRWPARELGPGDQTNMAFMNTPVTHGSGVDDRHRRPAPTPSSARSPGCSSATAKEKSPLTKELDTLTPVDRRRRRPDDDRDVRRSAAAAARRWDVLFVSAVSLAIAAIPEALPTVTQVDPVARQRRPRQAQRDRQGPALGRDARLHLGDQLGQDRHADDEPDDGRRGRRPRPTATPSPASGYGLEGKVHHAAGAAAVDRSRDPALRRRQRREARRRQGRRRSRPRGRCSCSGTRPGSTSTPPASGCPRLATLPFDPTYKLMATFNSTTDAAGRPGRALLRQRRRARGDGAGATASVRRASRRAGTPS